MIGKALALKVLNEALATGGDYAEIFLEDTLSNSVSVENGKVESSSKREAYGAGVRILQGFKSVYGYTSNLGAKSLISLAHNLAASFTGERKITVSSIKTEHVKTVNKISDHLQDVPAKDKVAYLKECYAVTAAVDKRLVRIIDSFADSSSNYEVYSAEGEEGKCFKSVEERGRLIMAAIANDNGHIEQGFMGPGRCAGWSWFTKTLDYKARAKRVGEKTIELLTAKECPSGVYPVVIANGWGGVVFHESCGHSLEASATAKHLSIFSDSIGKQIASPLVSAYDDGTLPNEWGSFNLDSEGHVPTKNQLIKDGICTGFMVDKFNGRRLNMEATGCSRRQSYRYEPTSRMTNTYIAAGKSKPEDIIKSTKLGLYVVAFGGGSVQPTTGEFNFSADETYIIRDGKVGEMVKGCTLIGSGKEMLMKIDMVGNDLDLGQGTCGAASGYIPVNVGQPTIRISAITVGGRGGKLE